MKKTYKILNLYACLGGNRYKWDEVAKQLGIKIEVTAVELDPELARLYKERFPNDNVIVADAHQYLLDNYMFFDFIWTSPPCPSHSRARAYNKKYKAIYPDMKLYEEIILLQSRFEGKYVVENVNPYYTPLMPANKRGRHLYWTNFLLPNNLNGRKNPVFGNTKDELTKLCIYHDINLSTYKGKQSKVKIARNLVDYEVAKTIFQTALGVVKKQNINQVDIFDHIK